MNNAWKSLAVVCVLVIGTYAYMAESGSLELLSPDAASTNYNLLVQGFRTGHLHLEKEVPPGLAQLPDPYDATANAPYWYRPYRLHDLSYYKGRPYLYFGVTPALILFWPYVALTGHYLFLRQAVAIFCTIGFLASVSLLHALWRRYFAKVSVWVSVACVLALGLATGLPVLLSQADVNQVAISCGYMLTTLTLVAIWHALHETERRCWWLALAVPLTWRNRSVEAGSNLRWFVTAVALLFGTGALTIGLFYYTSARYEMEFLPALLLLAVIGILGLEHALADGTTWRCMARWTWGPLLVFSVVFNLLMSVEYHADTHNIWGVELLQAGKVPEVVEQFEQALRLKPDYVQAYINLGNALEQTGKIKEAIAHYEQALRINPDLTNARNALARLQVSQ